MFLFKEFTCSIRAWFVRFMIFLAWWSMFHTIGFSLRNAYEFWFMVSMQFLPYINQAFPISNICMRWIHFIYVWIQIVWMKEIDKVCVFLCFLWFPSYMNFKGTFNFKQSDDCFPVATYIHVERKPKLSYICNALWPFWSVCNFIYINWNPDCFGHI